MPPQRTKVLSGRQTRPNLAANVLASSYHDGVGYLSDTTNKLLRSNGISGRLHDLAGPSSLNHITDFVSADDVKLSASPI